MSIRLSIHSPLIVPSDSATTSPGLDPFHRSPGPLGTDDRQVVLFGRIELRAEGSTDERCDHAHGRLAETEIPGELSLHQRRGLG